MNALIRRRSNKQNGLRAEWVQEQKHRKKLLVIETGKGTTMIEWSHENNLVPCEKDT